MQEPMEMNAEAYTRMVEILAAKDARIAELEAALSEAIYGWEDGAAYKGDYLREKHGDAEGITAARAVLLVYVLARQTRDALARRKNDFLFLVQLALLPFRWRQPSNSDADRERRKRDPRNVHPGQVHAQTLLHCQWRASHPPVAPLTSAIPRRVLTTPPTTGASVIPVPPSAPNAGTRRS